MNLVSKLVVLILLINLPLQIGASDGQNDVTLSWTEHRQLCWQACRIATWDSSFVSGFNNTVAIVGCCRAAEIYVDPSSSVCADIGTMILLLRCCHCGNMFCDQYSTIYDKQLRQKRMQRMQ